MSNYFGKKNLRLASTSVHFLVFILFHVPIKAFSSPHLGKNVRGNLRNHDGDAEVNGEKKMDVYFIYGSLDTSIVI